MKNRQVIKRLLNLLSSYRWWLLLSMSMAMISVVLNLYAPLLIGEIIDAITMKEPLALLFQYLMILASIYILYSFTTWLLMLFTNKIAFTSSFTLREKLFKKMQKLSISYYDTHEHGDLLSRFVNDIDMVSDGLLQGISILLNAIVTIILAIFFMYNINFIMTLIVLLCAPFIFFVAKLITQRSYKYFQAQTKDLGHLNGFSQEMIYGIKTLKAYGQEDASFERFQECNNTLYNTGRKSQFYGSLANPSTRFITNTAYTIVGVAGAILCIRSELSIGNISSFLLYATIFAKPFNEISGVITQLQSALASAQRIFSLFDLPEEKDIDHASNIPSGNGHIRFCDVSFAYQKDKPLLKHLTIDIPSGSRVAIVGKTGSGKTTFVNLLMRFYEIDQGSIYIDNVNVAELSRDCLRSYFGMVLQDTYVFEDSILHNIAYGKKDASFAEIEAAAKKSGADEFISQLPEGYDTYLRANTSLLSQGQRQLLSITRVILMNPSILILDEATSNIDTRSEQYVSKAMQYLMQGKTSFVIAHRLSTIINSDLILVMDQGDIIEQGTHTSLLANKGAYYDLYHSQFVRV